MCEHQTPTPAERVIDKLGGTKVVSAVIGRARQNVERWKKPRAEGGTGGLIPAHHQVELLRHAIDNDVDLTLEDLFPADIVEALRRRCSPLGQIGRLPAAASFGWVAGIGIVNSGSGSTLALSHGEQKPGSERKP